NRPRAATALPNHMGSFAIKVSLLAGASWTAGWRGDCAPEKIDRAHARLGLKFGKDQALIAGQPQTVLFTTMFDDQAPIITKHIDTAQTRRTAAARSIRVCRGWLCRRCITCF